MNNNNTTIVHYQTGSCLIFNELLCIGGSKRGIPDMLETRIIPDMKIIRNGTIVGWTVSGMRGSGTEYPKLQIWRRNHTNQNDLYHKIGLEIQIDDMGTACKMITKTCSLKFHCRLSPANQVTVQSETDVIGIMLPPFNNQAFELFFKYASSPLHYIWRRGIHSSKVQLSSKTLTTPDNLLLSIDISPGELAQPL